MMTRRLTKSSTKLPIRTDSFDGEELVKQLKNGKSCDANEIPGEVIKYQYTIRHLHASRPKPELSGTSPT